MQFWRRLSIVKLNFKLLCALGSKLVAKTTLSHHVIIISNIIITIIIIIINNNNINIALACLNAP